MVCNKRVIESLIKAGVRLDGSHRRGLMECFEQKVDEIIDLKRNAAIGQDDLSRSRGSEEAGFDSSPVPDLPEWEKSTKLAFEREMLGLYVSDHPLQGLEHVVAANRDVSLATLMSEDGPRDTDVAICGLLTSIQRKQTRNGDIWAILTVEDLESSVEVLLFPKYYQPVATTLATDIVVRIRGTVREKEESVELTAREITFPDVNQGPAGPVTISLPPARCTPPLVEQLRSVLRDHPGLTEVRLRLVSPGHSTVWRLDERLRVQHSPALIADLKALLGPSAVSA